MRRLITFLRYVLLFYRNMFYISMIGTIVLALIFMKYGLSVLQMLLIGKLLLGWFALTAINRTKRNEFYFFANLGIAKKELWIGAFSIDLMLFLIVLCIV